MCVCKMFLQTYTYIYLYVYTCIHMFLHIYICKHVYMCIHIYMHRNDEASLHIPLHLSPRLRHPSLSRGPQHLPWNVVCQRAYIMPKTCMLHEATYRSMIRTHVRLLAEILHGPTFPRSHHQAAARCHARPPLAPLRGRTAQLCAALPRSARL